MYAWLGRTVLMSDMPPMTSHDVKKKEEEGGGGGGKIHRIILAHRAKKYR